MIQTTEVRETQAGKAEGFEEKRAERRRRVLKSGVILFNRGYASFSCRVRNLTKGGALLEMSDTTGIPSEFDFRMSGEGTSVPARVVWRDRERVGISYA